MSKDFGGKSARRKNPVTMVATIGGGVAMVAAVVVVFFAQQHGAAAETAAWTPPGPPCQPVSQKAFVAFGSPIANATIYDGVKFGRTSGYQKCGDVAGDDGHGGHKVPVCQYNDPTALQITTAQGDFYFLPQSQPATVVVEKGTPRCTLAANTAPDWFQN